jgi:hypothetical protein
VDKAAEPDKGSIARGDRASQRSSKDAMSFYGTETFTDAIMLAERGWHEGASKIAAVGEAMYEHMSNMVIKPTPHYRDDPGMSFDIPRLIIGEPECWLHIEDVVTRGSGRSILRLVFNASADAAVATDVVMAKGAIVAALTMLLETSGFGIEVVVFCGMQERCVPDDPGKRFELYTTIKHADQPIHVLTLAYALAQPATFRRLAFSLAEQVLNEEQRKALHIPGFYGYPTEASHTGDLYVPSAKFGFQEWLDPKLARRWVIDNLKAQGVSLRGDE